VRVSSRSQGVKKEKLEGLIGFVNLTVFVAQDYVFATLFILMIDRVYELSAHCVVVL